MRTIQPRLELIALTLLISLASFSQEFKKIPAAEVDMARVKVAESFALDIMNALKDSSYYEFKNDEAIDALKNSLTKEVQTSMYSQLKGQFGDFLKADYVGVWQQTGDSSMLLVRFKADFSASDKNLEIRVVLVENNRISGFWIFPWSDSLGK